MVCGAVWCDEALKLDMNTRVQNNWITIVSSIVNTVVFVCMGEGDDHIMSVERLFFDANIFIHTSSKIMRKVNATSISIC